MALNFEGPIAFDADAVPVNYFDQDLDGDDCFLQPSPRAEDRNSQSQFQPTTIAPPASDLQDASLTSPIPSSTIAALDLASPSPAKFHFPDSDDSEFSDLGRDSLELSRQASPIDNAESSDSSLEQKGVRTSFSPKPPHPVAAFGLGGKMVVWFNNKPQVVALKNLLGNDDEFSKSLVSLPGPLLVDSQHLGQFLESARLLPASPSLSSERAVARELLCHTLVALYSANEKPFEPTVAQHLMESLNLTPPTPTTPDSPSQEISSFLGEIDEIFKVDKVVELERLLLTGDLVGTQNLALKLHSSSHALVLSLLPHPPPASYPAIINFALSLCAGPLRSMYLRVARYQGQLFDDLRWREHLLLALFYPGERGALVQLANRLETIPEAANICHLIIGEPPIAQFTSKIPPRRKLTCSRGVVTPEALTWCEIFEFIHHRHLHVPVPEFHLDLQVLKYVMAGMLSDFGHCEKAYAYVSSVLQQGGFSPEFLETLQWFQYELQQSLYPTELQVPAQSHAIPEPIPQVALAQDQHLIQQGEQHQYQHLPLNPQHQSAYISPAQHPSLEMLPQAPLLSHPESQFQSQQLNFHPNLPQESLPPHQQHFQQQQLPRARFVSDTSPHLAPQPMPPREQHPPDQNVAKPELTGRADSGSKKNPGGGWLSGFKKLLAVPEVREANLEQDNSFYYDEKLGRYVGTWKEETPAPPAPKAQEVPLPPPPPPKLLLSGNSAGSGSRRYALDASLESFIQ